MNTTEFYIIPNHSGKHQYLICQDAGDIKICVLNLQYHTPYYNLKEKQYFGDDHGDPLAFETVGFDNWDEDLILAGIRWYARYLDYPQMEISTEP